MRAKLTPTPSSPTAFGDRLRRLAAISVVCFAGLLLLTALLVGPAEAQPGTKDPGAAARALLTEMQASYKDVQTFGADFIQTSSGMSYPEPLIQKGRLSAKRPSMMRWNFKEPNKQEYISDGSTFWFVDHDAKSATVYQNLDATLSQFFMLLTGMKGVEEDFQISIEQGAHRKEGAQTLKLVPRRDGAGLGTLYMHIDSKSHFVTGVTNVTPFGDTTLLDLYDILLDVKFADDFFAWKDDAGYVTLQGN